MTLLDEVRRFLAEDARRRATEAKPLFATAGAVDLALTFVRDVPERLEAAADRARTEWTPDRFGDAFADIVDEARDSAEDAVRAVQQQGARLTDPAAVAASARSAAEQALGEARKAPGRVAVSLAEGAGAVLETYDDLAERGRVVFARLRGDAVPGETATSGRPGEQPPVFRRPTSPTAPANPPTPPPAENPDATASMDPDARAPFVRPDDARPVAPVIGHATTGTRPDPTLIPGSAPTTLETGSAPATTAPPRNAAPANASSSKATPTRVTTKKAPTAKAATKKAATSRASTATASPKKKATGTKKAAPTNASAREPRQD